MGANFDKPKHLSVKNQVPNYVSKILVALKGWSCGMKPIKALKGNGKKCIHFADALLTIGSRPQDTDFDM